MDWQEITNFILNRYQWAKTWEPEKLENWVVWAAFLRFLFLVFDNHKLVGLAIARPVAETQEYMPPNAEHDSRGQIIYVDLAISDNKKVLQSLCLGILERFPDKPKVAFNRFGRAGGVKTYDFLSIRKALLRRQSHGQE